MILAPAPNSGALYLLNPEVANEIIEVVLSLYSWPIKPTMSPLDDLGRRPNDLAASERFFLSAFADALLAATASS